VNRERIESVIVEVTSEVTMDNRYEEVHSLMARRSIEHILLGTDVVIMLNCNFTSKALMWERRFNTAEVLRSQKRGDTWIHKVWMGPKTSVDAVEAVTRFMEKNGWTKVWGSDLLVVVPNESPNSPSPATLGMRFLRSFPPEFPHLWALVMHMLKCVGWEMIK